MRTIRSISFTALVLIGLCGLAAYFSTKGAHDRNSTTQLLFILTWLFSGVGVAISAVIICGVLSSKNFGKRDLIGDLFTFFAITFTVIAILGALITWCACVYTTYSPDGFSHDHTDATRFACIYVGVLAGLIIGFFGILLVNARDSWTSGNEGGHTEPIELNKAP